MAGGKLSPRQKMINLMYLVFIAMLALQMSKEVLTAFGYLNERLETFNLTQVDKNAGSYDGLELKFQEQPDKYRDEIDKARKIRVLSQELYTLIDTIKEVVLDGVAEEDRQEYETLDKADNLDVYLYQKGKVTEDGQAFLDAISKYKNGVISVLGSEYEIVSKSVEDHFNTDDIPSDDGVSQAKNWIDHSFVGFPAVASLTKLTLMQTDIRSAERQILSAMLGGQ